MAATKKATAKKATTKRVSKTTLPDIMWVVSERKLLTWSPLVAYTTREQATNQANILDSGSGLSFNKFKVDRVAVGQ